MRFKISLFALVAAAGCAVETDTDNVIADNDIEVIASEAQSLERGSLPPAANYQGEVDPSAPVVGSFRGARYVTWSFEAREGQGVEITANGANTELDTVLFVYTADLRTQVAANDDFGDALSSYVEFDAPHTGTFLAIVRRFDRRPYGTVELALSFETAEPEPRACGGRMRLSCEEGEYCAYELDAICGAADKPGTCQPVPELCTLEYAPVCACDGNTYSNACGAAAAGTSVLSLGECEPVAQECGGIQGLVCGEDEYCTFEPGVCLLPDALGTCAAKPEACIQVYDPVCGCDGQTYSNRCVAASAGIAVYENGACQ